MRDILEKRQFDAHEGYRAFAENTREGVYCFEINQPIAISLPIETQIDLIFGDGWLIECNAQMARLGAAENAESLIGEKLSALLPPHDPANRSLLRRFIESNYKLTEAESHKSDPIGTGRYFVNNLIGTIENGCLVRVWATQRDQTARKLREQALLESADQIRQMQKFEALGILTGGIAHDFNNFLAVVMLHSDMLSLQLPADSPLHERINQIKTAAVEAADTVRQLLAFSRRQMMQPRAAAPNQIIAESNQSLQKLLGERIKLKTDLDAESGICLIDSDQMKQVLMNLAANARDAMPNGGTLTIQTRNVRINRAEVRHKAQPPGDYIRLTFTDTGTGMNPAVRDRVFEPFFTTKTAGSNSGLGLATVYGIVKQSNGFVWVESEPGNGARFIVELPQIACTSETAVSEAAQMPIITRS